MNEAEISLGKPLSLMKMPITSCYLLPSKKKWAVTVVPIYTRKTYTYIVKLDNSDFPKNSRKLLTHATISMVSSVSCS